MSDQRFTITGPPRTKKTHHRIVKVAGKTRLIRSRQQMEWADEARRQLVAQSKGMIPWQQPMNLAALIYREANTGDTIGYLQAICDVLQAKWEKLPNGRKVCTWPGIVTDDKWIKTFDGSRPLVDKSNPRVEIVLTPLP